MLICVPGRKLREMLNLGEQLIGISPSHHSSSFFNIQSPRYSYNAKKSRNISSHVHLQRAIPLLVKQTWSLSLSSLYQETNKPDYVVDIGDSEPTDDEKENDGGMVQIIPTTERIEQPQAPLLVMDSKISEILGTLRRHFSCIPDFRHMRGLKVIVSCRLMFESEPFNRVWGVGSPGGASNKLDNLPALYATVLKFSSSAPYGSIPSYNVPFLLGEPSDSDNNSGQQISLDIVPLGNGLSEEERFRAPVTIELEPREPTPGLVDVCIETNTENGEIIRGQLHSVSVGIEDMFLKPTVPPNVQTDAIPDYYSHLFSALWEACDTSCNTGRETFPLKGGKGLAAINGTRSVKLLEIPASSLIQAIEQYLAPFVVCVIGEPLCSLVKDDGIIRDISWKDVPDSSPDDSTLRTDFNTGPLHLTYIQDVAERDISVNVSKRNLGCFHILIFLPPRFHLLFQMEVSDVSTLVRIRTDHWPCLAYIDDYLEALFLAQ